MTNHKWTKMEDALPPIGERYLAYMPTARTERGKMQVGIDNVNASGHRLTIIGGLFGFDQPPVTKWILLEEITPNPEED